MGAEEVNGPIGEFTSLLGYKEDKQGDTALLK